MKTYIRFLMTFSFVMSVYYIAINFVGIRGGNESSTKYQDLYNAEVFTRS